ncbi:MAG: DNA-3-methyladenine glycosylase 2 family protein [Oscillospiraceae bacterium]|nr:DNA-3-methyladenine glycosylase 2 family protein [Oscillospiraceae bacterium]
MPESRIDFYGTFCYYRSVNRLVWSAVTKNTNWRILVEYIFLPDKTIVKNINNFDPDQTLDCGQAFRWQKQADNSYTGTAFGRTINVAKVGGDLVIANTTPQEFNTLWLKYFDLETDYEQIKTEIKHLHPTLQKAAEFAPGIRILRQEPFEALVSFIISQNNNIKRIKGIIDRLCANFGQQLPDGTFAFPTPSALASLTPAELEPIRAGFRHRYIIDCAQKVASGQVDFEVCRFAPLPQARAELMKICGVGTKVADCVLLFGFYRLQSFPLDVWMKRAMQSLFLGLSPEDFGPYAGIAQQYIFHYCRMNPNILE